LVTFGTLAEICAPLNDEPVEAMLGGVDVEISQVIDEPLALEIERWHSTP
jgi:hypothetical protein